MSLPGERRFAERRQTLARQAERRRFQVVAGLAALTTVAVMAVAFLNSAWFDVDQIQVDGNDQASRQEIVEASAIVEGDGLLTLDLSEAAQRVERVAWVDQAQVARSWGGHISISVTERSAVAALPVDGNFVLVDRSGRQLEIVSSAPERFLPIHGLDVEPEAGANAPAELLPLLALLEALSDADPGSGSGSESVSEGSTPQLQQAEIGPEGISLTLADGEARVLFGDGEELTEKLQAFATVLTRVDTRCLAVLDIRVPAAPVIRRSNSDESPTSGSSDQEVPDSALADC